MESHAVKEFVILISPLGFREGLKVVLGDNASGKWSHSSKTLATVSRNDVKHSTLLGAAIF
jgi:hypothetical protein